MYERSTPTQDKSSMSHLGFELGAVLNLDFICAGIGVVMLDGAANCQWSSMQKFVIDLLCHHQGDIVSLALSVLT